MSVPLSCTLAVRAVPGSSKDAVVGWVGEAIKVKVRAPAVDGRANEALCAFIAGKLGLPKRAVSLLRGESARQKLLRIEGLGLDEAKRRLADA